MEHFRVHAGYLRDRGGPVLVAAHRREHRRTVGARIPARADREGRPHRPHPEAGPLPPLFGPREDAERGHGRDQDALLVVHPDHGARLHAGARDEAEPGDPAGGGRGHGLLLHRPRLPLHGLPVHDRRGVRHAEGAAAVCACGEGPRVGLRAAVLRQRGADCRRPLQHHSRDLRGQHAVRREVCRAEAEAAADAGPAGRRREAGGADRVHLEDDGGEQ
mmetsp:Transcript_33911/g.95312  ORF Transcript_33911/g.95312 Transcript_33911/m.95312 type:complete len:218 (-) Transcript_33911:705-1358(-)